LKSGKLDEFVGVAYIKDFDEQKPKPESRLSNEVAMIN
jgi:hypothetical protein